MLPTSELDCGGKRLDLTRPNVMGILNVTPDSFSDGGKFFEPAAALEQAHGMVEEGADIIDIGGESTRPGSSVVSVEEEIRRVVPIIRALAAELDVPISIDTSKPQVMKAAAAAGAGLINDVMALRERGAMDAALVSGLPVCLMHMRGQPRDMQDKPAYADVVKDVLGFLQERVHVCVAEGIPSHRLLIDPGFGFGKLLEHNLSLLKHLGEFNSLGLTMLVGISRKSMIGSLTGRVVDERVFGSVAAAVIAVQAGARIIRVHDVAATADALKVAHAVLRTP